MTEGMSIVHVRASVCESAHMEVVMRGRIHVTLWKHMSLMEVGMMEHASVASEVAGELDLCCREECTGTGLSGV